MDLAVRCLMVQTGCIVAVRTSNLVGAHTGFANVECQDNGPRRHLIKKAISVRGNHPLV